MRLNFFPPREPFTEPMVVSIGVFDGIHLGHQKIIQRVKEIGREKGYHPAILTFPYPPSWYMKDMEPVPLLMSPMDKLKTLYTIGVKTVFYLNFYEIKDFSPSDFLIHYLLPHSIKHIVVGENFHFGKKREGDVHLLKNICEKKGVGVDIISNLSIKGETVSSSRIRELAKEGKLKEVKELLGRSFSVTGKVVSGKRIGKQLGFPTINLKLKHYALPPSGVYAGRVKAKKESWLAAIDLRKLRKYWQLEAHLLGFNGELYRRKVEVSIEEFIRERKKIKDLAILRFLIQEDIKRVKKLL